MKKRKKNKKAERLEISILLKKGYSLRDVARELDRSPNSISYKVKRNSVNGIYARTKPTTKIFAK